MNCDTALPLLYDLIDGELAGEEEMLLKSHLAGCTACQLQLESIRAAEQYYHKNIIVEPATDLLARLVSTLEAKKDLLPKTGPSPTPYWLKARVGAMAAALATLAFLISCSPEASQCLFRGFDLIAALNPKNWSQGWQETIWSLTDIHLDLALGQLFNTIMENLAALAAWLPSGGGYLITVLIALIALQIFGNQRLLARTERLPEDKNLG
ncbi:MAG: zf-HC2 domain-containing protein [Acidobacteriota bacterium]